MVTTRAFFALFTLTIRHPWRRISSVSSRFRTANRRKAQLFPGCLDNHSAMSNNNSMKKRTLLLFFLPSLILLSCAPVLNRTYMREGSLKVSFNALREYPDQYKGKLYILGGVIVQPNLTEAGSELEAMHVPVDRYGYFEEQGESEGRYLAMLPKTERMLDPLVFGKGRRVTLAGEFTGLRKGRIDEMDYVYPEFRIVQIYLWPLEPGYYYPAYYYDPWFYPYPFYFWDPWWRYPHYYNHYYDRGGPPPSYWRLHPPAQQLPVEPRRFEGTTERVPETGPMHERR